MPIPIAEVEAYCRIAGIDAPDRYEFLRIIRTIDLQFLDLLSKRKKTTLAQPKG